MQRAEINYLVDKQLAALLAEARQILGGNDNDDAIRSFYKHSAGVKRFMKNYIHHTGVQKYLAQVPDIAYNMPKQSLFSTLVQIVFISLRDKRNAIRQQAIEGIRHAHHIYSSIYFLHEMEAA